MIVPGVGKGFLSLHFECNPRVLRCNLKPSNVMLDGGFGTLLKYCGAASLIWNRSMKANEFRKRRPPQIRWPPGTSLAGTPSGRGSRCNGSPTPGGAASGSLRRVAGMTAGRRWSHVLLLRRSGYWVVSYSFVRFRQDECERPPTADTDSSQYRFMAKQLTCWSPLRRRQQLPHQLMRTFYSFQIHFLNIGLNKICGPGN